MEKQFIMNLSQTLKEPLQEVQERLKALEESRKLPAPKMKEGLSTSLDETRMQQHIENMHYHHTTSHLITHQNPNIITKLFSQADENEQQLIHTHRYKLIASDKDNIISLHRAATDNGVLIIIPPGEHAQEAINLTSQYDQNGFTHLIVIARKNSTAHINRYITEERKKTGKGLIAEAVEIYIEEGATITYNELQDVNTTTAWYSTKKARTAPHATINWYSHITGSTLTKQTVTSILEGIQSEATNLLTCKATEEQHIDTTAQSFHKAAETKSGMYAKAVVADNARFIHKGLIDIGDEAMNAEGYQQEDALLIGEKAEADALPNLEIKNPDVQCSHGATVGQINPEQLYYLQTRGFDYEQAKNIITDCFLASINEHVQNNQWESEIMAMQEEEEFTDEEIKQNILDEAKHPTNKGTIDSPDVESHHQQWCGEELTIQLKLDDEKRVEDIKFSGTKCAMNTATTSMISKKIKGMKIDDILKIPQEDMLNMIGLPKEKLCLNCTVMPLRTINKGLIEWVVKQEHEEKK